MRVLFWSWVAITAVRQGDVDTSARGASKRSSTVWALTRGVGLLGFCRFTGWGESTEGKVRLRLATRFIGMEERF